MYAPLAFAGPQPFNDWFAPDTVQRHPLGLTLDAVDPWWGPGRFMYVNCQSTMERGSLAQWTMAAITPPATGGQSWGPVISDLPSTAGLGRQFGVTMAPMISGNYGWIMLAGFAVISASASVAADTAVAVAAAGQIGALANGKQLLGVRNVLASTATLAKTNVQTTNGSAVLKTSGYDGWFLGMALSGSGIPASTVIAKLDPDGRTVYTGSAVGTVGDKNSTATAAVTVTGTWTGYCGTMINLPFSQGQVV